MEIEEVTNPAAETRMRGSWKHHICESCWFEYPGNFIEHVDSIKLIRIPVRRYRSPRELFCYCCLCAKPTVSGIFIMKDPATVVCGVRGTHGKMGLEEEGEK